MLAVILKILQITGIVLLSILGFILVMLILILVMPVRYSVDVSKKPEDKLKGKLKVTYFFGIVRALAEYEEVFEVNAKVLWFKFFSMKIPDKDADDSDDISLDDLDDALDEEFPEDGSSEDGFTYETEDDMTSDTGNSSEGSTGVQPLPTDDVDPDTVPGEADTDDELTFESVDETEENDDEGNPEGPFAKLKYKFDEICDKIDKVKSEIRYYYNIYNSNEGKNALKKTGKHLKKIFRKLLPRKITAKVTYGFSSPDLTGKVYGIYCIIADRFTADSVVTPDFDRELFEGTVKAKGYFNIWGILINVIAIVINKDAIRIIRSVRRHLKKKDSTPDMESGKAA
ncbi:MAG: hypothetical protein K6G43_12435 [Lachnospiraceae bacterium]|nr:hypothetical protein [Lachnospiraceae bacterium]